MTAVVHARTLYGWRVEEESLPDDRRRLVCRKGARLMDLAGTPDVSRAVLYERGVEALLCDDAFWAAKANDRRGVAEAGTALRRHRLRVAANRLERAHAEAERRRDLILTGRLRRPDPADRDGAKLRALTQRGLPGATLTAPTATAELPPEQFRRLAKRLGGEPHA